MTTKAEPTFTSGIGWPIAILKGEPADFERCNLRFQRDLDDLGEINFAIVLDSAIGLVKFEQRVQYPEHGITIEVDSATTSTEALEWLKRRYGFGPEAYSWTTEYELEPDLAPIWSKVRGRAG